jgi:transcriptional regulator with GAF, ATPase, and Fis domain
LHRALPPPLAAVVRVLGAKASPAAFALRAGRCVIGAAPGSDIIVSSPAVSRSHVELTLLPEGCAVHDLGSRNGTFYLGSRVEKITVALGSRLRLGDVEVAIDADLSSIEGLGQGVASYRGLVGASAAMRRLFATLVRLEGSLVNVLVEGESGSGKELVAQALHQGSALCAQPLVVVNCGAIAQGLVLSTLFGHRRGAFTGAVESRVGAFEAADGGTLFLDEIGELPLEVQPALLRALESGEVQPLGASEASRVRVRIIAATNRDLEEQTRAGRFREDLFYRLAVIRFRVPPLRERPEDIELLAGLFAGALGVPELPASFLASLGTRAWPGNVRELRNAVQAFIAVGAPIEADETVLPVLEHALQQTIVPDRPYAEQKDIVAAHFTRTYLQMLIVRTRGNQSEAARISGLDRSYLGKLLLKHGIIKP